MSDAHAPRRTRTLADRALPAGRETAEDRARPAPSPEDWMPWSSALAANA